MQWGKKREWKMFILGRKTYLFTDDTIIYVENSEELTEKLLKLISDYSKVSGYKTNIWNQLLPLSPWNCFPSLPTSITTQGQNDGNKLNKVSSVWNLEGGLCPFFLPPFCPLHPWSYVTAEPHLIFHPLNTQLPNLFTLENVFFDIRYTLRDSPSD